MYLFLYPIIGKSNSLWEELLEEKWNSSNNREKGVGNNTERWGESVL